MNRAETLEQLTRLCNLNREGVAPPAIEPTGFGELDAVLPNGGWQSGTIVELMPTAIGIGELRLLMPALARMTAKDRHVALVSPPYIPFAPALNNHGVRLDRLLIVRAEKSVDALGAAREFSTVEGRSLASGIAALLDWSNRWESPAGKKRAGRPGSSAKRSKRSSALSSAGPARWRSREWSSS